MGVRLFDPEEPTGWGAIAENSPQEDERREAAPGGPLRRVRLLVAYDGSAFHGFAPQPGQVTVAGRLTAALARVAGHPVTLTCAGRTDAGVHASGQVVHADVAGAFFESYDDPARLVRSLSHQVGPEVVVLDVREADTGFHARRSALSRSYRYLLLTTPFANPLLRHLTWHVGDALDVAAMRLGADALLGEHDFAAFCRRPPEGGSTRRRVIGSSITEEPSQHLVRFEIEANAFCHQMVRSIVGALVSVGEGRLTAADVLDILRSGERSRSSRLAPPGGLCLESVRYPPDLVEGGVWLPPDACAARAG